MRKNNINNNNNKLADHKGKTEECEKIDKYIYLVRELRKLMEAEIPIVIVVLAMVSQKVEKETGRIENLKKNREH